MCSKWIFGREYCLSGYLTGISLHFYVPTIVVYIKILKCQSRLTSNYSLLPSISDIHCVPRLFLHVSCVWNILSTRLTLELVIIVLCNTFPIFFSHYSKFVDMCLDSDVNMCKMMQHSWKSKPVFDSIIR